MSSKKKHNSNSGSGAGDPESDLEKAVLIQGHPPKADTKMAFVPRFSRPQVLPPLLCSKRLYVHIILLISILIFLLILRFVSQMRLTFVHYHMESDRDAELVTLPKSYVKASGAYCLDGSPPAYYYRPSPLFSSKNWIIYLPGGAWCVSEQECFERSLTALGSSHVAPTSENPDGLLSKNCNHNPDFCLWNVLIFLYCDGGSFLGNQSKTVTYKSQTLYMRGARVFDVLVDYLMGTTQLRDAEQIVLAGSSAGGVAALVHVDRLRSKLPPSVKTLHVIVDAAMFVDIADIDGEHSMAKLFRSLYHLHSLKDSQSVQECTEQENEEEAWRCVFPGVYQKYVFTPAFFTNSIYDNWLRTNILNIHCFTVTCPEAHTDAVYRARDAIQKLAEEINASKKNGVFLTYCPSHTLLIRPYFYKTEFGDPTIQKMLSMWFQHSELQTMTNVNLQLDTAIEVCQMG